MVEFAGEAITLLPGTHTLDADITEIDAVLRFLYGAVLKVSGSRSIACAVDFSNGGRIQPASGVTVTLAGKVHVPDTTYAFDVSLGGLFNVNQVCLTRLTPYHFGAVGDGVAYDDVAVRGWARSCQWSIGGGESGRGSGGVQAFVPPGAFKIGSVHDVDSRGDHVCVTWSSLIDVVGVGERVSRFVYLPTPPVGPRFFCMRWEEGEVSEPALNPGLKGVSFNANKDETRVKVAIDLHDVRNFKLREVEVVNWADSSASCIGLRLRGRDANCVGPLKFHTDIPIVLDFNDDETEPLDRDGIPTVFRDTSQKDIDHLSLSDVDLISHNVYRAGILIRAGVVVRNISINGDATLVGGGLVCVDRIDSGGVPFAGAHVVPRRVSNHIAIAATARVEGIDGPTSDDFAIRIERHPNAPLRELTIDSFHLGEGYDARRFLLTPEVGLIGPLWGGIRAKGVWRLGLGPGIRYSGRASPLETDADCKRDISPAAELVPSDNNRRFPESDAQWALLAILPPRSWWMMRDKQGNTIDDFQTTSAAYNLEPLGTPPPTHRELVDGWLGFWIKFTEVADQKLRLNRTDAGLDPAAHSVAALGVVLMDSSWTPGADRDIANLAGDADGPLLRINPSGALFIHAAGVSGTPSTLTFLDNEPFVYWLAIDHTRQAIRCWVRKFTGQSELITTTYSVLLGNNVNKGFGPSSSATTSVVGWQRFGAWFLDAAAEQVGYDVFDALGWKST